MPTILSALALFWLLGLTATLLLALKKYRDLTKGISPKNITSVLTSIRHDLSRLEKDHHQTAQLLQETITKQKSHIQKLGLIRYNPFGNTGGDQSFCLCLLDQQNSGILITSLHTRQLTRTYIKEIYQAAAKDNGKLSKEELRCLKQAVDWGKK